MNLSVPSPAKINLHLKVFEKFPDGYHRVETSMVKVSLFDQIELSINDGNGVEVFVEKPFAFLSGHQNLAYKATAQFLKKTGIKKSVSIRIQKNIPLGAGLGGGSSNAGVVLSSLNRSLNNPLSEKELLNLGKNLGADVPFFIQPKDFALMKGRGDELVQACHFPFLPVLIVYPNFEVSTKDVYQALQRSLTWKGADGISGTCDRDVASWKDLDFLLELGNDLQEVTEKIQPVIQKIRGMLKEHGAQFSQMSGSGASVFGLFNDEAVAQKAIPHLEKSGRCFLVRSGTFIIGDSVESHGN